MRYLILPTCLTLATLIQPVWAQNTVVPVRYTSPAALYSQYFDGLPLSGSFSLTGKGPFSLAANPVNGGGLDGWQVWLYAETNTNAAFTAGTGSSTGSGVYSFGNSGSPERALGSLASGTGVYAIGVVFTNETGTILNQFTLSFTAEQWRKGGSTNKNLWAFRYKTGAINSIDQPNLLSEPKLDFGSLVTTSGGGSLNGNLPQNRQLIRFTVTGIKWKQGEQLLLRWDDADEAGSDDAVGIDDLHFSAELVSSPPSVTHDTVFSVMPDSAFFSATVNENFSVTSVWLECDTSPSFTHPAGIPAKPDTIVPGSGNTTVAAVIGGLLPGTLYYGRIKAGNSKGTTFSHLSYFTTGTRLASVITLEATPVTDFSTTVTGRITASGGTSIVERGFVWAVNKSPTILDNKIIAGADTGKFSARISALPPGSICYVKAYAINAGGIAYGDSIKVATPTGIQFFRPVTNRRTRADSVDFVFQTNENISGLAASHFSVLSEGITGAALKTIAGNGNRYTLTVVTGLGDGKLGIRFTNDANISPPVSNKPIDTEPLVVIDKTPPFITALYLPDKRMKLGDTIPVIIHTTPDTDYLQLSGSVNGFVLQSPTRKNDSVYTAFFIIERGGNDVAAAENIPVTIAVKDSAGNYSLYTKPVSQPNDLLDANAPRITAVANPGRGMYKSGDSLCFSFRFSETVFVTNGIPSLTLTIGNKSKHALYFKGNGTDSLQFRYRIGNGDLDTNGIKTAGTITRNKSSIADAAGNEANTGFNNKTTVNEIRVDAVIPVIMQVGMPASGEYKTGDTLGFRLSYSKRVWLTQKDSIPYLEIHIGRKLKKAFYAGGSGSTLWQFRYIVDSNDVDTNGITLGSKLSDPENAIRDSVGNIAAVTWSNGGNTDGIRINLPTIRLLSVTVPPDGRYKTGDTLSYSVIYNEPVWVGVANDVPYIKIRIGDTGRQAKYRQGSGSNRLFFSYVIQPGELDTNGIQVSGNITLNGSRLFDARENIAPLQFAAGFITYPAFVDAVAPVITQLIFPEDSVFKAGDTLKIAVCFSEKITWNSHSNTIQLLLHLGTAQKKMFCESVPGTDTISFRYPVQNGDLAKKGISIADIVISQNHSLTDLAGNPASLFIKTKKLPARIRIDAQPPSFTDPIPETITRCANSDSIPLSAYTAFTNSEAGEQLSCRINPGNYLGTLNTDRLTLISNGKNNQVTVFCYYPHPGKWGTDTLSIFLSDGVNTTEKKVMIVLQPPVTNNRIGNTQVICAGEQPSPLTGTSPSGGNGNYRYVWEMAGIADSTAFSMFPASGSAQLALPVMQTSGWFRRKVVSGYCSDSSAVVKIEVIRGLLWKGIPDHNWHNPANWCLLKIPTPATDVTIYPGTKYFPVIQDTASCHQLILNGHAKLSIENVLQLSGNILAAANSITAFGGTLLLNGTLQQPISGDYFQNRTLAKLVLNNDAGAVLKDSLSITRQLVLTRGKLETNHFLQLKKNASVGPSAEGTAISGKVLVEHFVPGGRRVFRLMAHPFREDIALEQLAPYMDITGENGSRNGFTTTAANLPSAFLYDEQTGRDSGGIDAGWRPFTHTNGWGANAWKP